MGRDVKIHGGSEGGVVTGRLRERALRASADAPGLLEGTKEIPLTFEVAVPEHCVGPQNPRPPYALGTGHV